MFEDLISAAGTGLKLLNGESRYEGFFFSLVKVKVCSCKEFDELVESFMAAARKINDEKSSKPPVLKKQDAQIDRIVLRLFEPHRLCVYRN